MLELWQIILIGVASLVAFKVFAELSKRGTRVFKALITWLPKRDEAVNISNAGNAIRFWSNRAPATATEISHASAVTTSQPQGLAHTNRTPQPTRPATTLVVPRINNRNRASRTPPRQQPQATTSEQSSTENQSNNPGSTLFPTPNLSSSVNESNTPSNPLRTGNAQSSVSLHELHSFYISAKFQEEPCSICLEPLRSELVSAGNCLHLIHTTCLKRWFVSNKSRNCPICRLPVAENFSQ